MHGHFSHLPQTLFASLLWLIPSKLHRGKHQLLDQRRCGGGFGVAALPFYRYGDGLMEHIGTL